MKTDGRRAGLDRDALKLIAAAAMLLDHVSWRFLAFESPLSQLFHTIGRVTLPIMCYFLAEGYAYTRSKIKYALRIFVFALLSQIPYAMFQGNAWDAPAFNVLFTLLFSFLAIAAFDQMQKGALRWLAVLFCIAATWWCDWPLTAVLFTLAFWVFRADAGKRAAAFSAAAVFYFCFGFAAKLEAGYGVAASLQACLYLLGVFLALALLSCDNLRQGRLLRTEWGKWSFYLFYPAHLLLLALL